MSGESHEQPELQMIYTSIFEIQREHESPDFMVTWDSAQLRRRQGVQNALLHALGKVVEKAASSKCQVLAFKNDESGKRSSENFRLAWQGGRRRNVWQNFAEKLASGYREQKGFREGAMLFALFSANRRTRLAVLRVDFEADALQVIRGAHDVKLAGEVFLPEKSIKKAAVYPFFSKDKNSFEPDKLIVFQNDAWAHYFVDFLAVQWHPDAAGLTASFNVELQGAPTSLNDLMNNILPSIKHAHRETGGATTRRLRFEIDDVTILFSDRDFEKNKVSFRKFDGQIVGLVVGSRLTAKYGGHPLNARVDLDHSNDLNQLARKAST